MRGAMKAINEYIPEQPVERIGFCGVSRLGRKVTRYSDKGMKATIMGLSA